MAKPDELTPKQAAFVREYLVDHNGTQAAIRAGYSAKTAASQAERLLRNVDIRAAVDAAQTKIAEKTETDAEWVRRRLKEEADDFSEFSSHSARIKAIELVGKINGVFEKDNEQQKPTVFTRIELVGVKPKARE
jgi:phage terminase small subunit